MIKDQRLKDYNEIIKDLDDKNYNSFFYTHQFPKICTIVTWLADQINQRVENKSYDPAILFEKAITDNNLSFILNEADAFYYSVFNSKSIISEHNIDLKKANPLSTVVNKIYNSIWDIVNESELQGLIIYSELEKHVLQLLGKETAIDPRYTMFSDWRKIYHITQQLYGFYNSWISNINKQLIESNRNDLFLSGTSGHLHELAYLVDYHRDREKVSNAYEINIQKLSDKSDWSFIKEATDKSDYISLREELELKEDLLLKTDIKYWLIWVDNLKWPILQDHVFYSIQDHTVLEQIIEVIVGEKLKLRTKLQHFLLIAVKNYYKVLEKISSNLYHLKENQIHYYDNNAKQEIIDESIRLYDNWTSSELEASCIKVFQLIFGNIPVTESKYFEGIFDLINSYSKQNYIENKYSEPALRTLKIFNQTFENILVLDTNSKSKIISGITPEKINWQVLEKLIILFQKDENDSLFHCSLYKKYVEYIESDYFNWNLQVRYHEVVINQAYYLSYIMTRFPNPLDMWFNLFNQFKCWHEGWVTTNNSDYRVRSKEIYVLTVGACFAYYYSEGETAKAKEAFDKVLRVVLSQYRNSSSWSVNDYEIVLRFLSHTISSFSYKDVDSFIKQIDEKCDDVELFLVIAYEITLIIEKGSLSLCAKSILIIKNQIDNNFWKIENRYDDRALLYKLDYFLKLKKEILNNLNKL